MKIAFLVPAYNVKPWTEKFKNSLSDACANLKKKYELETHIVFVDDGSKVPGTQVESHIENLKSLPGCFVTVTRHRINRGQGAALMTALRIARGPLIDADYFVTFDADGQHNPHNIDGMLDKLVTENCNIVFGNRFAADKFFVNQVPIFRKILLRGAILFENFITGIRLSDAHNGLRLFDKKTAHLLNIRQDRMAHATEIKIAVYKAQLRYGEAPVEISYENLPTTGGQTNGNAINIIQELIREGLF